MSGLLENVRRFIDSLGYESDVVHIVTLYAICKQDFFA